MVNPIDKHQKELLEKYYSLFNEKELTIEFENVETFHHNLITTLKVQDKTFKGIISVTTKPTIEDIVNSQLIALQFAAISYGINLPFEDEVKEEELKEEAGEALTITKYDIIHTCGNTVKDVYTTLKGLGVNLERIEKAHKKIVESGQRMTKEKLADIIFPNANSKNLVVLSIPKDSVLAPSATLVSKKKEEDDDDFVSEL